MIDYQNQIFTALATELRKEFKGIKVVSAISSDVAEFPCVQIEEVSNVPIKMDSSDRSFYASVLYQVSIYTNDTRGKVQKARKVLSVIDDTLEPMNLIRTSYTPADGLYGNSVYRILASYRATIDKNGVIYRR